jgi:hypothetical protein
MDFYIRVAFVVFEPDVEMRLVFFDQVHFQDQSFQLGLDDDPIDVLYMPDQLGRAGVALGAGMEVGPHPMAEIDRFSDVNNLAVTVFHQITAGLMRDRIQDALEVF